jgi:hypothetical protein
VIVKRVSTVAAGTSTTVFADIIKYDDDPIPALIWTKDAVTIACSGGIFGGDKEGQLRQYHQNNFVKIGITYTF